MYVREQFFNLVVHCDGLIVDSTRRQVFKHKDNTSLLLCHLREIILCRFDWVISVAYPIYNKDSSKLKWDNFLLGL